MKTTFVVLALAVAGCSAAKDVGLAASKPVFLLQPFIPPPQQVNLSPESIQEVTKAVMERLRSEEGAQSGNYYVYLPDGKLQKVEFTTAPLVEVPAKEEEESARLQEIPPRFYYIQDSEGKYTKEEAASKIQEENEKGREEARKVKGYVASVQYTDVEPINAPVYAYNNAPLTRVLRYAPDFF